MPQVASCWIQESHPQAGSQAGGRVAAAIDFPAGSTSVITSIAPNRLHPGEYRTTLAAGLPGVVAARITGIAAVWRVIDPRIDVKFAAAIALATTATRVTHGNRTARFRATCHRADAHR